MIDNIADAPSCVYCGGDGAGARPLCALPEKTWIHWPSGKTAQGHALAGVALGPFCGTGCNVAAYILQSKCDDLLEAFRQCFPEPKRIVTGQETGWPSYGYPPVYESINWEALYRNLGYDGCHGQTWLTAPDGPNKPAGDAE